MTLVAASGKAAIDKPQVLGFSADGSGIIVQFMINGDPQWRPLNLADNTWGAPLARGASFSQVVAAADRLAAWRACRRRHAGL
jgi:hypothetical protein